MPLLCGIIVCTVKHSNWPDGRGRILKSKTESYKIHVLSSYHNLL